MSVARCRSSHLRLWQSTASQGVTSLALHVNGDPETGGDQYSEASEQ